MMALVVRYKKKENVKIPFIILFWARAGLKANALACPPPKSVKVQMNLIMSSRITPPVSVPTAQPAFTE